MLPFIALLLLPLVASQSLDPVTVTDGSATLTLPHIIPGAVSSGASVRFGPLTEPQGPATATTTGTFLSISPSGSIPLGPGPVIHTSLASSVSDSYATSSGSVAGISGATGQRNPSTASADTATASGSVLTTVATASGSMTTGGGGPLMTANTEQATGAVSGTPASSSTAAAAVSSGGAAREGAALGAGALAGVLGLAFAF